MIKYFFIKIKLKLLILITFFAGEESMRSSCVICSHSLRKLPMKDIFEVLKWKTATPVNSKDWNFAKL